MKLLTIMWSSFIPILRDAAEVTAVFNLKAYSNKQLNLDPRVVEDVGKEMKAADLIVLYRTTEPFWDEVEDEIERTWRASPDCGGRTGTVLLENFQCKP